MYVRVHGSAGGREGEQGLRTSSNGLLAQEMVLLFQLSEAGMVVSRVMRNVSVDPSIVCHNMRSSREGGL